MKNSVNSQTDVSDIDQYIGKQVSIHRRKKRIAVEDIASTLGMSLIHYSRAEDGVERFAASDLFTMAREFGLPLSLFFSSEADFFSDVILDDTEMAKVFHHYSSIKCSVVREHLLKQIVLASNGAYVL